MRGEKASKSNKAESNLSAQISIIQVSPCFALLACSLQSRGPVRLRRGEHHLGGLLRASRHRPAYGYYTYFVWSCRNLFLVRGYPMIPKADSGRYLVVNCCAAEAKPKARTSRTRSAFQKTLDSRF